MGRVFTTISFLFVLQISIQQEDNNSHSYDYSDQQQYLGDILAFEDGYDDTPQPNNHWLQKHNQPYNLTYNLTGYEQYIFVDDHSAEFLDKNVIFNEALCDCKEFDFIEDECRDFYGTCTPLVMNPCPWIPQYGTMECSMSRYQEVADNWPYLVSFQKAESPDKPNCYRHFCGGSLITTHLVLTAAHCFEKYLPQNQNEGAPIINIYAALNPACRHAGSRPDYTAGKRAQVTYMYLHPDWDRSTGNADIAILVLDTLFDGPYAVIYSNDTIPENTQLYIAGYGVVNKEEMVQRTLYNMRQPLQVLLDYISPQECNTLLTQFNGKQEVNDDTMVCSYNATGDTCPGDSGGPLAFRGQNPEDDVLVGVISWGPPLQCQSRFSAQAPVVATKISAFIDWIDDTLESYFSSISSLSEEELNQKMRNPQEEFSEWIWGGFGRNATTKFVEYDTDGDTNNNNTGN